MEDKIISVNGGIVSLDGSILTLQSNGTTLFSHELTVTNSESLGYEEYKITLVTSNPVPFENSGQLWSFLQTKKYLVVPTRSDEYPYPIITGIMSSGTDENQEIYFLYITNSLNTDIAETYPVIVYTDAETVSDIVTPF